MAGRQSLSTAYNNALAEVTRVIREQVRLIEDNNASTGIEYQRRINREMTDFAETWGVLIRIEARPNPTTTNQRQGQRQIDFLSFEVSEQFTPAEFYTFIHSLPCVPRDSLGEDDLDNQCSICYYPFFKSRGMLEAEAILNGTAPRPNMNLEPHHVPLADLPELPVRLPCGHIFGHICVQVWITGPESGDPPKCPNCRAIWRPVGWSDKPMEEVTIVV